VSIYNPDLVIHFIYSEAALTSCNGSLVVTVLDCHFAVWFDCGPQQKFLSQALPAQSAVKVKVKADIAVHVHLRATGRHLPYGITVLSATWQVNAPRLTPAMQAGTRLTYPGGMEGWVDLVDLIAPRSGVEPATFGTWVWCRTTAPPSHHCDD